MVNPQPASSDRIHVTRSRAKPGGAGTEVEGAIPFRSRKPPWLKVPPPGGPTYRKLKATIGDEGLNTVCEEAHCPNVGDPLRMSTATTNSVPIVARISFAMGGAYWKCRPRTTPLTERE